MRPLIMIKIVTYHTEFKMPQSVEFSESDYLLLRSNDPKSKAIILNTRKTALWKRFRKDFAACYYLSKGFKWGILVFLLLAAIISVTKPFVEAPAVAGTLLTLSIMCAAIRLIGVEGNRTYPSYKRFVKAHIKLLEIKIEEFRPEWH